MEGVLYGSFPSLIRVAESIAIQVLYKYELCNIDRNIVMNLTLTLCYCLLEVPSYYSDSLTSSNYYKCDAPLAGIAPPSLGHLLVFLLDSYIQWISLGFQYLQFLYSN